MTARTPSPSPVDLPPPAARYIGRVALLSGPSVPVVVQRHSFVLIPGGREIQLKVSTDYTDACWSFFASHGHWIAYTAAKGELRVVDTTSGKMWSLGTGCAPVWGTRGLAYLIATRPTGVWQDYRSVIVVRTTPLGPGRVWASGRLQPIGWAGERLVFQGTKHLAIASRPGAARTMPLHDTAGPWDVRFVAASPDGSRLILQRDTTEGPYVLPRYDLVDGHSLRVLDSIDGRRAGLGYGAWGGNTVIAPIGTYGGGTSHPQPVLIELAVWGDRLRLSGSVNLDPNSDGLFDDLDGLQQLDDRTVVVRHDRGHNSQLLECRIATLKCHPVLPLDS